MPLLGHICEDVYQGVQSTQVVDFLTGRFKIFFFSSRASQPLLARGEQRISEYIALQLIEGWQEEAAVPRRQQSVLMNERKSLLHVFVVSGVYLEKCSPIDTKEKGLIT